MSLDNLGVVAREQGDYAAARSLLEESLALSREIGDKQGIAMSLDNLGIVAQGQGDYAATRSLHEESLALRREIGDKQGIALSVGNLGLVALEQGDYAAAQSLLEESLVLFREIGDKWGIAMSLAGLGSAVVGRGQTQRGVVVLGAVEALLESIGAVLEREDREPYERSVQRARSLLGEEAFEQAWQEGWHMSTEEAIEYGLGEKGPDVGYRALRPVAQRRPGDR
jgi:tetratricopeptide (TPR) repeat protein